MAKMRQKLALLLVIMILSPFIVGVTSVFAAASQIPLTSADGTAMAEVIKKTNDKMGQPKTTSVTVELKPGSTVTNKTLITTTGSVLTFNPETYEAATDKSKKKAMKAFVDSMQNSNLSSQGQQSVIDGMSAGSPDVKRMLIPLVMDSTSADLYTAMKWINPILPVVRLIFGIGAIVVSIMLIGSTIVDLCFIGLPIAREALNNKGDQKGGNGKVPFVSADAVSVIKESESALDSSGGYKNAYVMYFKRRVLTYIIISICLLYLVVGELGGLIAWLMGLGDGVVSQQ